VTLRWVRKRDGRRVPFDSRKLATSIAVAARAAGEADAILAAELAEVVALFLERDFRERIPDTSELEDLVERVLLETNHARTAAVYAERLKLRDRTRAEIVVERGEAPPVAPDGEPLPAPPGEPWNEGRIVEALEHRCGLAPELAEEVATAVESKVFALGFRRVPVSLIREIVDGELQERGFSARLGRPGEVAVPTDEVRRILVASYVRRAWLPGGGHEGGAAPARAAEPAPGGPEAAVGVDLLTRFALGEIYPDHVAEASRAGRIHIQDVGRPLRIATGALSLEAVKAGAAAPRDAGEVGLALARVLASAARSHARAIGVPYANVFLTPLLRGKEAAQRRDLRDFLRVLQAPAGGPEVHVHVGRVPDELADVPALGARGRRWRACYGELRAQAERTARLLVEIAAEERALGVVPIEVEVSDEATARLLDAAQGATIAAPGLAPQVSRGFASGAEMAAAIAAGPAALAAAGAAQIVAINCAAAAYRAGRGDEPAFRRELDRALDLAIEAVAAKWAFLEGALYRPKLPLWERAPSGEDLPVVEARRAAHVLALVGLDEAYVFLTGEPPAANPAVARLAGEAIAALAQRARSEGARRGLALRLEEPDLERASRRLADLDLQETPAAREVLGLERGATELRYSTGFGGAPVLMDPLYRAVGVAPYLPAGPGARERALEFLAAARRPPPPAAPLEGDETRRAQGVLA
jgi:ribonucleoside-triphosphate reductase